MGDGIAETLQCNVSSNNNASTINSATTTQKNEEMAKISPKSRAVSTIIRSYKSVVSKHAHFIHPYFNWQTRFHDHIIRNSKSFERIQNYIESNPANWDKDKFYQ